MCLLDEVDYPDPEPSGKETCCFFCNGRGKVLFCCTRATISDKQCQELGWRNDGNQTLLEVAWIASDEIIGLALGSGDGLDGILEIAPTESQRLLQDAMINRFDAKHGGEVDQNSSGLALPQMPGQQVMQGGKGVRSDMPGCAALLDVRQKTRRIVKPWLTLRQHIEHDVGIDEEFHRPCLP